MATFVGGGDALLRIDSLEIANSDENPVPVSGPDGGPVPVTIEGVDITIDNVTVSNEVEIKNDSGSPVPVNGTVNTLAGLEIPPHDYISLSYTGSDLTGVVYKDGGVSGTTVATLTLAYTSGNLTSVTKS